MNNRISTETDGITLEKSFDDSEFNLPSIVYEISNRTTVDRFVRLAEQVPDELEPGELGFHDEYGRERWELDGRSLEFEQRIEAESEVTTVIGIRRADPPAPEDVLVEPDQMTVETQQAATPGASAESATWETDSGMLVTEPLDRPTTIVTSRENGSDSDDSEATEDETTAAQESVVAAFVNELRDGDVPDADLQYLEEHFGAVDKAPTSVEARIGQLQQDVADLRAYKASLEGFLDEHGSAGEVIERFETRLDDLEGRIETIEERVEAHETDIDANRANIADNEESIERVSSTLADSQAEIETVAKTVAAVEAELPEFDIEERIRVLDDDLAEMKSLQEKLKSVFAGNGDVE